MSIGAVRRMHVSDIKILDIAHRVCQAKYTTANHPVYAPFLVNPCASPTRRLSCRRLVLSRQRVTECWAANQRGARVLCSP